MRSLVRPSRRRQLRQRGSSLVELSMCFLGFLLLTVGTMEFGMAMYAYNFCSYAARDATRWASVRGSQSQTAGSCTSSQGVADGCPATVDDIKNYILSEAIALTPSKFNWTDSQGNSNIFWTPNNGPGGEVNVTVSYTVVPLAGLALKENLTVASTSIMEMVH
jgi:Flp pilus assembly protein TadG